jgi:iron complex outermembrane receptor protein
MQRVSSRISRIGLAPALVLSALVFAPRWARAQLSTPQALGDASLEDLMNVEVTSVSRKEEKLSKTAAAAYVISQEDIHRSGATNIPDVLRMAPGVDVAQIDANTWAISIRGFNDQYANLVLVLIDGRTVYTPISSGVYWDQLDVPLEDIDRIEITRGPGGTIWGANAVNGVINIITKNSGATQGADVSAGGGSQGKAQGLAQYGGKIGQIGTYRVFGDYANQGNLTRSDGINPSADGWHMSHGGFRSDWKFSPSDSLTVQGDFIQTSEGGTIDAVFAKQLPLETTVNEVIASDSGNVLARWSHKLAGGSETSLQVYFDRYNRISGGAHEALDNLDVDFQDHLTLGARHDIVWGAGYRLTSDSESAGYAITYVPSSRTTNLFSTFLQDEIDLGRSVWFTLGSKVEHNAYTGFEFEPSAKLLWQPTPRQAVWISAARAIVQTSRIEANLVVDLSVFPIPGGVFGVAQAQGNPDSQAQQLYDFEAGYRAQVNKQFSFDIAAFSSSYRNIAGAVAGASYFTTDQGPPHVVLPLIFEYGANAQTYGAEAFGTWTATRRWKISPSISAIHLRGNNTYLVEDEDNTPQIQTQIRSSLDLTSRLNWDIAWWHIGRLRDGGDGAVPAYNRVDTRFSWRLGEFTEVSVVGQNLLTHLHAEFHNDFGLYRTLVERSVFGKIAWHF